MMEEHFMRGWVHGHERMSADLDRAVKWLGVKFRAFVDLVTPSHAPGEDSYFARAVPARREAKRAVPVRVTKRR